MTAVPAVLPTASVLHDLLGPVAATLQEFIAAPSPVSEAAVRVKRNALARACLDLDGETLRRLGATPALDRLLDLMRCGLRVLAPSDEEMGLIETARRRLAEARDGDALMRATVAFCLLQPPHRLPRIATPRQVPPELHDLLIRAFFVEPEFFTALGEAESHVDFIERVVLDVLDVVESDLPLPMRQQLAMRLANFGRYLMTYFTGRSLATLYRARARVTEFYLQNAGHVLHPTLPPRPADRTRIRVGVLRPSWAGGAETAATFAHLNGLDRGRFEVILYAQATADHPVDRVARGKADRFVVLPGQNLIEAVRQIRADDLDILLIGINVTAVSHFCYFLSAFRLARAQIALTLSPATTGFRAVDHFLNGTLNEPADAQDEYTEKLLLVPGSINRYDFAGENLPPGLLARRQDLGIPEDAFVFISGANFYKIVPELLDSWARVLKATPGSHLVLYPFNPNWTNLYPVDLFSRHARGFLAQRGIDPWRVHIVRPQPTRAHIHAIIRLADLYLDSFPFSGAVSIMDPAGVACPVLLLEGRPARARQSAGLHAEVGLGAVLTHSTAEYEAEAIRLAGDRAALNALRMRAVDALPRARDVVALDLNEVLLRVADGAFS